MTDLFHEALRRALFEREHEEKIARDWRDELARDEPEREFFENWLTQPEPDKDTTCHE